MVLLLALTVVLHCLTLAQARDNCCSPETLARLNDLDLQAVSECCGKLEESADLLNDTDSDRLRDCCGLTRRRHRHWDRDPNSVIARGRICRRAVDLMFAVDASGSVGGYGFKQELDFVIGVTKMFGLSRDKAHASVLTYSDYVRLEFGLKRYYSLGSFARAVRRIRYTRGLTRIDLALKTFAVLKHVRQAVPKILIVMTDGHQTKTRDSIPLDKAVLPLRQRGYHVYALGIGPHVNTRELRLITEKSSDVFMASSFVILKSKIAKIAAAACQKAIPNVYALYPLNQRQQARDFSGNNAPTGHPQNIDLVKGPYGRPGGAFGFRGRYDSYVEFFNRKGGKIDTQRSLTISLQMYYEGGRGPVVNYKNDGVGVGIWTTGRTLMAYILGRRGYLKKSIHYPFRAPNYFRGRWYYVAMTYDWTSGKMALWINNHVVKSKKIGKVFLATQYPVRMGSLRGRKYFRYAFKGRITCLQFYGLALNAAQLASVKGACAGKPPNSHPCQRRPCRNGGSCLKDLRSPYGYRCRCQPRYIGRNCEHARQPKPTTKKPTRGTGTPKAPSPSRSSTIKSIGTVRIQILDYINRYRRLHGTGPLMSSDALTTKAQRWATTIAAFGRLKIDPKSKYGSTACSELISEDKIAQTCAVQWYSSVMGYDWATPKAEHGSSNFARILWDESQYAGVGVAKGPRGKFYIVVYYDKNEIKDSKLNANVQPAVDVYILVPGAQCPTGYTQVYGKCFKYHTDGKPWQNAVTECAREMSTLASLHAPHEELLIKNMPVQSRKGPVWIGLNDRLKEGVYTFSDGSGVDYLNWKQGESNSQSEDCVALDTDQPLMGSMVDHACGEKHQYLCEQPLEGVVTYRVKMELPGLVWLNDFFIPTTLAFQELKIKMEQSLKKIFDKDKTFLSVSVESFSNGQDYYQSLLPKALRRPSSKNSKAKPKVTSSVLLKFGPKAAADPTTPLQDTLKKSKGKVPSPLGEEAKIASIKIIKPGAEPATMGACQPQCALSCSSRCQPVCCTSQRASSTYNPAQQLPFPGQPPLQFQQVRLPPIGFPQSGSLTTPGNPCIRTALNPCLPRTPIMAKGLPFSTIPRPVKPCLPKANKKCPPGPPFMSYNRPQFGMSAKLPIPCVPSPTTQCPPPTGVPRTPFPSGSPPMQVQYQIPVYPRYVSPPRVPFLRPPLPFSPPMVQSQMASTLNQVKPPPFLKLSPEMTKPPQLPVFGIPFPQVAPRPFVFPRPQVPKCIPSNKRSCHPTVKKFEKQRANSQAKLRTLQQQANKPIHIDAGNLPTLHVFYPNQPTVIKQPVIYQPVPQQPFGFAGQPMTYQPPPQAYPPRPPLSPSKLKASGKSLSKTPRVAANPLFYSGALGAGVPPTGNNFLPQLVQQNRLPYPPLSFSQYRPGFSPLTLQSQQLLPFNQPSAFPSQNKPPPFIKFPSDKMKLSSLPAYGSFPSFPAMSRFSPYPNQGLISQFPQVSPAPPIPSPVFPQLPTLQTLNRPSFSSVKTKPPQFLKLSPNHVKKPRRSPFSSSMFPQFPPMSGAPFPLPLMSMMKNPPKIIPQTSSSVPNFAHFQQLPLGSQLSVPPLQLPAGGPLQFPQSRAPFPLPLPSMMKNPPPFLRAYINSKPKAPSSYVPPRPLPAMYPQPPLGFQQPLSPYQSPFGLNTVSKTPPFLKFPTPQNNPRLLFYGRPMPQPQPFLPMARPLVPQPQLLQRGLVRPPFSPLVNRFLQPFPRNLMPIVTCPTACSKNVAFCPDYCPKKCCVNGVNKNQLLHLMKPKVDSKPKKTTKGKSGKTKKISQTKKKHKSHHS